MNAIERRKKELAKIHIGKSALDMDQSTYVDMLWTFGRVHSSADLDSHGRHQVIKHMEKCGVEFTRRKKFNKSSANATDAEIGMIMALWSNLVVAGIVRNPSDTAFRNWLQAATRHIDKHHMGWQSAAIIPGYAAASVIEQLKKWCDRTGVKR